MLLDRAAWEPEPCPPRDLSLSREPISLETGLFPLKPTIIKSADIRVDGCVMSFIHLTIIYKYLFSAVRACVVHDNAHCSVSRDLVSLGHCCVLSSSWLLRVFMGGPEAQSMNKCMSLGSWAFCRGGRLLWGDFSSGHRFSLAPRYWWLNPGPHIG